MKVLILSNNDIGLYKFRKELIERLLLENDVAISSPFGKYIYALEELGCKYFKIEFNRRGTNPFADFVLLIQYIFLILKIKPDVVLTYTIKPNVYGGMACVVTRTPYLSNVTGLGTTIENGGFLSFLTRNLYKFGLIKAKCVFFQNDSNRKYFEEHRLLNCSSRLIPGSGVNVEYHCLEDYPIDESPTRFLFVGRIMKDKGIDELLEAFVIVSKKHDVKLDILGACDEAYEDILYGYEKEGLLKWHGMQDDVHSFMKKAHCIVLPSYHEGMANVLLEAASSGRPVIATDIPGCREIFKDRYSGFSCHPKSIDSLVEALENFINMDIDAKRLMGLRAREKIVKEFDRNIVIQAYFDEINKIRNGEI